MSDKFANCHPRLESLADKLIAECKSQGYTIGIAETFRTVAEQDALYAQGRTKPGSIVTNAPGSSYSSMHQWGIAFDFYRNDGQGAYNEDGNFFVKVGAIGKSIGLEWGGDWTSIVDKPHFQLPDWGSTPSRLKSLYGNYETFKKTWPSSSTGGSGTTTPTTPTPPTTPTEDNWVLRLQTELKNQGWNPGKIDGIAGPNTLNGCPTVRKGARGGITKLIQERLSQVYKIGIGTSGMDGIFGSATQAAVMEFQKQKGISIDGIVGKNTWRKLLGL